MLTDPIADMLTRIRNANKALHETAAMPTSRMKEEIARLLWEKRLRTPVVEHEQVDPGELAQEPAIAAVAASERQGGEQARHPVRVPVVAVAQHRTRHELGDRGGRGEQQERRELGLRQLWEAEPGSIVRIDSMHERDRKLLEYFDHLGIRPGVEIHVSRRNYDGTLSLRLGRKSINLGESAARKLWVSAAKGAPKPV